MSVTAVGETCPELVGDEGRDEAARVGESADRHQCRRGPSDGGTADPSRYPGLRTRLRYGVVGEPGQHRGRSSAARRRTGLVSGAASRRSWSRLMVKSFRVLVDVGLRVRVGRRHQGRGETCPGPHQASAECARRAAGDGGRVGCRVRPRRPAAALRVTFGQRVEGWSRSCRWTTRSSVAGWLSLTVSLSSSVRRVRR